MEAPIKETIGNKTTKIQTNYFGKGDVTTYDRATWESVSNTNEFHTYKISWSEEQIIWSIDGIPVRSLRYNDAQSGTRYPQTPMNIRLGVWAGGDSGNSQGTIDWAGGETEYALAPFTMYVKDVSVVNYHPAASYKWSDQTGSMGSIDLEGESGSRAKSSSTVSSSVSASASVGTASRTANPTSSASSSPVFNSASSTRAGYLYIMAVASSVLFVGTFFTSFL